MSPCRRVTFSVADVQLVFPVKNTFIHFDGPPPMPEGLQRAVTSPPRVQSQCSADSGLDWDRATEALCHAKPLMRALLADDAYFTPDSSPRCDACSICSWQSMEILEDRMLAPDEPHREASKARGAGPNEQRRSWADESLEGSDAEDDDGWTEVRPAKRRANSRREEITAQPNLLSLAQPPCTLRARGRAAASLVRPAMANPPRQQAMGPKPRALRPTPALATPPRQMRMQKAAGAMKSPTQKIKVGIEEDRCFRVVRRILGSRGECMRRIQAESKGAKVWLCGRGSCLPEAIETERFVERVLMGPLTVCVSASTGHSSELAVKLVQELLDKVHGEYRNFLQKRHEEASKPPTTEL